MRFLNFGSLNIDYVYQVDHFVKPGETMQSNGFRRACGGKGLNQSIALARAGASVWHAGMVGEEGPFLIDELAAAGVRTEYTRKVGESTGHAIIQIDASGENSIILYSGANYCFTKDYIEDVLRNFESGDIVLLQAETNLLGEIISAATKRGMRVALNAAPASEHLLELPLEKVTWLIVNETEGAVLSHHNEPDAIIAELLTRCPQSTIVLTLGEKGAFAATTSEQIFVPAIPLDAVDTTAAGDTFVGYFLECALRENDLKQSMKTATAASALAVMTHGAAASIPDRKDVERYLKRAER